MTDPWELTYEDQTDAPTDQRLVFELLCGVDMRSPEGRLRRVYPMGNRELQSREALARLIHKGDPFPPWVREAFAALFDPTNSSGRHVEFKPGRPTSPQAHTLMIAIHVWARMKTGEKKEAAVESAMTEFNLKRRQIFKICRDHDAELPGLASALK